MTVTADEFFSASNPVEDPLQTDIVDMVMARYRATPRHQQVELGPSEVGHPCMRKMAYGLMDVVRCNPEYDPLPSIIGTATHTWMESACALANEQLGRERWIAEKTVDVTPGLFGHADVYDTDTRTVIDWKFPGNNTFQKYVKDPGIVYKAQVQMYGMGFAKLGYPVETVAIAFLPRGGTLRSMHLYKEAYDPEKAMVSLRRREAVMLMLNDFRPEIDPDRYQWFPATPYDCIWCPWWTPNPRSPLQCKGDA